MIDFHSLSFIERYDLRIRRLFCGEYEAKPRKSDRLLARHEHEARWPGPHVDGVTDGLAALGVDHADLFGVSRAECAGEQEVRVRGGLQ